MKILRLGQSLCSSNGPSGNNAFTFTIDTTIAGSSGTGKFTLPLSATTSSYDIDWGDGTVQTGQNSSITHDYGRTGTETIKITGTNLRWSFNGGGDRLKMDNISNWGFFNAPINGGFSGCTNMTCTATDKVTVSGTTLQNYFRNCNAFNGDISNWDVSNVTNFSFSIFNCTVFNQPVGNWTTTSLENCNKMFQGSTSFDQSIGDWDITNATNLTDILFSATAANFSAANLTDIYVKWAAQSVPSGLSVKFGTAKYTAGGASARTTLTSAPNNWTITDGGQV